MIGRPSPGLGGNLPARGPGRWLRPVAYALVLVAAQGLLSRLADAVGWPAPDLFLLTGLALGLRAAPLPALLLAYGVGFGQDLLGGGALGLHAAGVAGGTLLVLLLRRFLSDSGVLLLPLAVLAALLGEWLTFVVLNYWLRAGLVTVDLLVRNVPLQLLLLLLVAPLWEAVANRGLGPRLGTQEKA